MPIIQLRAIFIHILRWLGRFSLQKKNPYRRRQSPIPILKKSHTHTHSNVSPTVPLTRSTLPRGGAARRVPKADRQAEIKGQSCSSAAAISRRYCAAVQRASAPSGRRRRRRCHLCVRVCALLAWAPDRAPGSKENTAPAIYGPTDVTFNGAAAGSDGAALPSLCAHALLLMLLLGSRDLVSESPRQIIDLCVCMCVCMGERAKTRGEFSLRGGRGERGFFCPLNCPIIFRVYFVGKGARCFLPFCFILHWVERSVRFAERLRESWGYGVCRGGWESYNVIWRFLELII